MLDAKEIVAKARNYLETITPDFAALNPKVEEMAITPDNQWRILFVATTGDIPSAPTLADLLARKKIEKEVLVWAETGNLFAVQNPGETQS